MITVLHEQRTTPLPNALADGEALWLGREDIERATGWTWKPPDGRKRPMIGKSRPSGWPATK